MYPITIIDNFLPNPVLFANYVKSFEYKFQGSNYPGYRTKLFHLIDEDFNLAITRKVFDVFYRERPEAWAIDITAQKIQPFVKDQKDQFSNINRGWIHQDNAVQLVGILYLDEDPLPNTGTNFYDVNVPLNHYESHMMDVKESLYLKKDDFDIDKYNKTFEYINNQYKKTISVENKFNRLVMFTGNQHHGAETFGYGDSPRHTLNVFIFSHIGSNYTQTPYQRIGMI